MKYYYNETEKTISIAANFVPQTITKGYKEITKKKYEELQEELNSKNNITY